MYRLPKSIEDSIKVETLKFISSLDFTLITLVKEFILYISLSILKVIYLIELSD